MMMTIPRSRLSWPCTTPTEFCRLSNILSRRRHHHSSKTRVVGQQTGCFFSSAARTDETMVDEEVPSQPQQQQSQHQHCPLYVAATRQHVGKTTTSLALLSGLQKRAGSQVGFIKPVGQVTLTVNDETTGQAIECDKDAVLVKQHFQLDHLSYRDMSPVLIPKGYTKDYLDGKILLREQRTQVERAYQNILQNSNHGVVLCEGTGHVAVGSVVDASNARVASWLGARMVLVANAGLGNCLDELDLNRVYCQEANVDIAGVIVNKCRPDKYEQTKRYLSQALDTKRWGHVPLLGLIPDRPFLGCPAIHDLERLLEGSELVSGHDDRFRHYTVQETYLVATSLEEFLKTVRQPRHDRTLYVCHASRNDILLGFLMEAQQREYHNKHHHHHHPHASNQPQQQQQPEQQVGTIRGLKGSNGFKYLLSATQFHANLHCLCTQDQLSVQWAALTVVQSSAFGMTLRRKCLITHGQGLALYASVLTLGMMVIGHDWHRRGILYSSLTVGNVAALLRMDGGWNKYLLWLVIAALVVPQMEQWQHQQQGEPSISVILFVGSTMALGTSAIHRHYQQQKQQLTAKQS
mmetsp:Transcript_20767/g.48173  ORF Transcript_20767/g.48173 Transcript_20767/m.48173 type:complete len:577 (+) Transcript_20767:295-2025(+)